MPSRMKVEPFAKADEKWCGKIHLTRGVFPRRETSFCDAHNIVLPIRTFCITHSRSVRWCGYAGSSYIDSFRAYRPLWSSANPRFTRIDDDFASEQSHFCFSNYAEPAVVSRFSSSSSSVFHSSMTCSFFGRVLIFWFYSYCFFLNLFKSSYITCLLQFLPVCCPLFYFCCIRSIPFFAHVPSIYVF